MWKLFFLTLVVAVSAKPKQMLDGPCVSEVIGVTTSYLVVLKRHSFGPDNTYYIDTGRPCNGQRVLGLFVNACNANPGYLLPEIDATQNAYDVQLETMGPVTVDFLGFCEYTADKAKP